MTNPTILYGPMKRQRLGAVLALDITAPQTNLVVSRGSLLARASVIVTTAARKIIEISKAGEKIEHLVVMGAETDPVLHPDLKEVTENLRALRDKWLQRAKLCIMTRAKDLEAPDLRNTLAMYDKLFLEFEWGTAKTFASATGEKSTVLATLTKQLQGFDRLIVQAAFYRGDAENSSDAEVKSWIKKLQEVRPAEVHIITGTRYEAETGLKEVTKTRRQQIADEVAEKTGITVSIHEDEPLLV